MQKTGSRLEGIKYNVHSCFQHLEPAETREISLALAVPVHLMLFNLDGNMNIAMSIRSAAVLGCSDIWIVGRKSYDARAEVGAKHYIRMHKIDSLEDPMSFFQDLGIQPLLVEQGGTPLEEMNFKPYTKGSVCFIMGSESEGIPEEFLKKMKKVPRLTISQYGMVRSLNVSISASIVIYEYLKQWRLQRKDP
jgi:tRNA G18 (ribose-2'-O)-methylase SpoU